MRLMEENSLQSSFPVLLIFWLISVFCIKLILVLSCVKVNDTIVHQIIYMQIHFCMCEFRPFIEFNIIHRFFILKETPTDLDKLETPHISKKTSFSADQYTIMPTDLDVRFYIFIHYLHLLIPDQQTVVHRMTPTINQGRDQLRLLYVDILKYEKDKPY